MGWMLSYIPTVSRTDLKNYAGSMFYFTRTENKCNRCYIKGQSCSLMLHFSGYFRTTGSSPIFGFLNEVVLGDMPAWDLRFCVRRVVGERRICLGMCSGFFEKLFLLLSGSLHLPRNASINPVASSALDEAQIRRILFFSGASGIAVSLERACWVSLDQ